jgi:hypothetical protein
LKPPVVNKQRVARQLRRAASFEPFIHPDGITNIASWVAPCGPAWRTVFFYSSQNPCDPWFSSLSIDDQRTLLLLVTEMLENPVIVDQLSDER